LVNYTNTQINYFEAIAIEQKFWSKGYGTQLIQIFSKDAPSAYSVSILSTSDKGLHQYVGCTYFRGERFFKVSNREVRTADEDQDLVLLGNDANYLTVIDKVVCESRSGDVW